MLGVPLAVLGKHRRAVIGRLIEHAIKQVAVRFGQAWVQVEGGAVGAERVCQIALILQRIAEIVVRGGIIGSRAQGRVESCHCFLKPAQIFERDAKIVMGFSVIGPEVEGAQISRDRIL